MNGLAFAPPCSPVRTGVSTSRNPRASSADRTVCVTADRISASRLDAGFTIRSRYRCRTRASGSVSPACFSGSGRSDLAVIANEWASTESSPDRDVITEVDVPLPVGQPLVAHLVEADHRLDVAGAVAQRREADLAADPRQHD